MRKTVQTKNQSEATVLRRLREASGLTIRQAGGLLGVAHTTISQFETGKRTFTTFRIEQLVKAYGYSMEEYFKILGRKAVINIKDDCVTMIDLMDDDQLSAIRAVMSQMLRVSQSPIATTDKPEMSQ
ncbi:MAG: helix-turn-helix transcriptional regulator [Bdellovibrio sp.]